LISEGIMRSHGRQYKHTESLVEFSSITWTCCYHAATILVRNK